MDVLAAELAPRLADRDFLLSRGNFSRGFRNLRLSVEDSLYRTAVELEPGLRLFLAGLENGQCLLCLVGLGKQRLVLGRQRRGADFSSTGLTERVTSTTPSSCSLARNSSVCSESMMKEYFVILVTILCVLLFRVPLLDNL